MKNAHISVKELVPIAVAAAIWGPEWSTRNIEVKCDNAAVVAVLNSGSSRDPELMHLLRCLSFFMAKFQFAVHASHVAGSKNVLADALSRNNLDQSVLLLHPQASRLPTPIPQELVDLLIVTPRLDLQSLDKAVEFYFLNALAPATRKSYGSAQNRYLWFCAKAGFDPVPASEQQLCRFVAQLVKDGLAPNSIKSYLSAVRHLHLAMHLPDPKIGEMARLEQVIRGSKCEYAKLKPGTHERLPITPELLLKMRKYGIRNPIASTTLCFGQLCAYASLVS